MEIRDNNWDVRWGWAVMANYEEKSSNYHEVGLRIIFLAFGQIMVWCSQIAKQQ